MAASPSNITWLFGLEAFIFHEVNTTSSIVQSSSKTQKICPHISQTLFFKDSIIVDTLMAEVGSIYGLQQVFGDNFWLSPETNASRVNMSDASKLKGLNPLRTGLKFKYDINMQTLAVSVIVEQVDKADAFSSKAGHDEKLDKLNRSLLHKRFYDVQKQEWVVVVWLERSNAYMDYVQVTKNKRIRVATETVVVWVLADNTVDEDGVVVTQAEVEGDLVLLRVHCIEYHADDFDEETLTIPHLNDKTIPADAIAPTPTLKTPKHCDRCLSKKLLALIAIGGVPSVYGGKGLSYVVAEMVSYLNQGYDDSTLESKLIAIIDGYSVEKYTLIEFPQYFKGLESSIETLRATKEQTSREKKITRSEFANTFLTWLREMDVEEFKANKLKCDHLPLDCPQCPDGTL